MAKKPNQREDSRAKRENAMHNTIRFFIAGFLAEA